MTLKHLDDHLSGLYNRLLASEDVFSMKRNIPGKSLVQICHSNEVVAHFFLADGSSLRFREGHVETSLLNDLFDVAVDEYNKGEIAVALPLFLAYRKCQTIRNNKHMQPNS